MNNLYRANHQQNEIMSITLYYCMPVCSAVGTFHLLPQTNILHWLRREEGKQLLLCSEHFLVVDTVTCLSDPLVVQLEKCDVWVFLCPYICFATRM